jgi:hypothetical protein
MLGWVAVEKEATELIQQQTAAKKGGKRYIGYRTNEKIPTQKKKRYTSVTEQLGECNPME